MAASKTTKKAPPKKASTKTAAPKKAAAQKIKQAKPKSTPDAQVIRKSALRIADVDPVESTEQPAEPVEAAIEEAPAQPVIVHSLGRGGAIRIQPQPDPVPEPVPEPEALADIPEGQDEPVLPVETPVIPPVEQVEAIEPVAAIPAAAIPVAEKPGEEIPAEEKPVEENHEVLDEIKKVEVKVIDVIKALWQKVVTWKYLKWVAIGLAIFAVIYLIDTIRLIKRNYDIKQTKKIEAKIEQKQERLNLTDSSIVEMQRQSDSLREVSANELQKASDHLKASEAAIQKRNNLLKLQRYELDNKIKSFTNNDDRRKAGSELAKPQ